MSIAENIRRVEESVAKAALRAGRCEDSVRIMGVSKFFSREAVDVAREAGLRLFGESRVQEAESKFDFLKLAEREGKYRDFELRLIGSLQRNKAKKAVELFDGIDSIDRLELIECLGGLTASRIKPLNVLLELNSGEEQKGGFRGEDELRRAVERVLEFGGLKLCGLMTVAPLSNNTQVARNAFRSLFSVKEKLALEFGAEYFFEVSMGMSGDYEIAIEEGATLVRIGTAIFGERV